MDCRANSDVFSLLDEKFDFDVSLSPASSRGDEDEVFVGPVSHKEKCVSANVGSPLKDHGMTWSPLTGEQLEAVCQEAHRVASQLQTTLPHSKDTDTSTVTVVTMTEGEEFFQDAESKLGLLTQTSSALSPIKRQTFCVQDSPFKQLPPVIQHHLQRSNGSNVTAAVRATATTASSTRTTFKGRLSTSSPVAEAKAQPRTALRGKAALGVAIVLPSKPTIPVTSSSTSKSRVEKTKLQAPKKTAGSWRRSPASCPSSRPESSEDLFSDSASVASDISDSSLNSSLLGKRTLALPTKQSGVRNLSGGKAPPLQTRRKNTSSSSSSVSSFNSSISLSPAKGKLNSSLNRSLSSSTGPAHRSVNSLSRPRRSTIYSAVESVSSSAASRRSLSTRAKKLSEAECIRSTPQKRADSTPSKRSASNLTNTSTSQLQSGLKTRPKPEAVVLPTPTTGAKGARHANDISKALKPKRLLSLNSMDSLPQKPSAGPATPSAISCKSLQMKARRPSALPTPVRRKASLIPSTTPKPAVISDPVPSPNSCTKLQSCSPTPKDTQVEEEEDSVVVSDIQPFCLEDEEPPASMPSNTQQTDQSERTDPGVLILDESAASGHLIEMEPTEESKTQEVLLLDLPPPTLSPQEKLLIDLTNTPDLIRTNNKTCSATQLIDLSSPLIKWSPEDKTENTAPLINLSF